MRPPSLDVALEGERDFGGDECDLGDGGGEPDLEAPEPDAAGGDETTSTLGDADLDRPDAEVGG